MFSIGPGFNGYWKTNIFPILFNFDNHKTLEILYQNLVFQNILLFILVQNFGNWNITIIFFILLKLIGF